MTRYQYDESVKVYKVRHRGKLIGEAWPDRDRVRRWKAYLYTDPSIRGKGRTRDDAVDDCLAQAGGEA